MTLPLQFTFTGPVTINQVDFTPIFTRLIAMEANMTAAFTTFDEVLAALTASVADLTTAEASDRAAFDSLAAAVRAFIASVPTTVLTAEQATAAQSILNSIDAAAAGDTTEAADEAALQGEVPV